ncbi:unnamed protein product [Dicrocoelium dendriticum]|nr:unnamed protein product [Dicrocoelium dendriticum]
MSAQDVNDFQEVYNSKVEVKAADDNGDFGSCNTYALDVSPTESYYGDVESNEDSTTNIRRYRESNVTGAYPDNSSPSLPDSIVQLRPLQASSPRAFSNELPEQNFLNVNCSPAAASGLQPSLTPSPPTLYTMRTNESSMDDNFQLLSPYVSLNTEAAILDTPPLLSFYGTDSQLPSFDEI